jgi:hypothetical protein
VKKLVFSLVVLLALQPIGAYASDQVDQKTVSGVVGKSLAASAKGQVSRFVAEYALASSLTCTAIRKFSGSLAASRASAKLICDYAKKLNPALRVSYQSKVTNKSGFAGKVLVTFRTPASSIFAESVVDKVPSSRTLTALSLHVKAVDQAARNLKPIAVSYVAGPTTVPSKVSLVVSRFQDKLKMYQLLGLTSLSMDWVIASEKDYEWWRAYRAKQEPNYPLSVWDNTKKELGHCKLSSDIFCGAGNGVVGKNYQDNVVGTAFSGRGLDYVTRHESAHFYQGVFGYGGRCWFAEGQATFFETYLETSSRTRSQIISNLKQSSSGVASSSLTSLEQKLASDSVCSGDPNVAYDLGLLAFEYLYMNFSFRQIHDLQVMATKEGWESAVRAVLGVDPAALNSNLARHVRGALGQ